MNPGSSGGGTLGGDAVGEADSGECVGLNETLGRLVGERGAKPCQAMVFVSRRGERTGGRWFMA